MDLGEGGGRSAPDAFRWAFGRSVDSGAGCEAACSGLAGLLCPGLDWQGAVGGQAPAGCHTRTSEGHVLLVRARARCSPCGAQDPASLFPPVGLALLFLVSVSLERSAHVTC